MTPPNRNPAVPPRTTPALIAPDRASSAVQLSKHNLVVDPTAPPMRAPPSRPMPAPAQKWPRVPSPLERRVTEVVGMTNAALLDGARISALWATPRLGARSSGRTTSRCRPKDICASFPIGSETEQPRRREQQKTGQAIARSAGFTICSLEVWATKPKAPRGSTRLRGFNMHRGQWPASAGHPTPWV